jgi:hypothetical protein
MIVIHVARFVAQTLINFVMTMIMTIIGFPAVAIGLMFGTTDSPETALAFTKSPGTWVYRRLKRPFLWWDNPFDGMLGDSEGDWNRICLKNDGRPCTAFLSMWKWAALRNPANYFGRIVLGIDVLFYDFELLGGQWYVSERTPGWQFIMTTHINTGKRKYCLRFCHRWNDDRVLFGMFGYKLSMEQASVTLDRHLRDRIVGTVARINPWKKP